MFKKERLFLLFFLLLIGFLQQNRFFISGIIMITGLLLIILLWERYCFSKLTVKRYLSKNKIFCGEESEYIIEVQNRKPIPLLYLQIDDLITKGVNFKNQRLANKYGSPYNIFSDVFSLKWYEKIIRKYPVKPLKRGYFLFGKGELKVYDYFGLRVKSKEDTNRAYLLVYPEILPLKALGLPEINPFGERQANFWIYEDPFNRIGVRPYRWGDPFNQINWKATAKYNSLYSNEIKPTVESKLMIILNTKLMNNHWEGFLSENFEQAVVVAASVADYAIKHSYQVGFLTNGVIYEESTSVKILPGKSKVQRERILEALAMIEPFHQRDIDKMVYNEMKKFEVGTTVVFITCILNSNLIDCLKILKKKGFKPTVIKIGKKDIEYLNDLKDMPVYLVEEGILSDMELIKFSS